MPRLGMAKDTIKVFSRNCFGFVANEPYGAATQVRPNTWYGQDRLLAMALTCGDEKNAFLDMTPVIHA